MNNVYLKIANFDFVKIRRPENTFGASRMQMLSDHFSKKGQKMHNLARFDDHDRGGEIF